MKILKTNAVVLFKRPTFADKPVLYNLFNIHRLIIINNIIASSPNDASLEPKRYSTDLVTQYITPSVWITLLSISLSLYIYIYMNKCFSQIFDRIPWGEFKSYTTNSFVYNTDGYSW